MEDICSKSEIHDAVMLTGAVAIFAAEPINAAYLNPENNGLRLVTDTVERVLRQMTTSPQIQTAMGNLESPSGKLLGFAYHPNSRHSAKHLCSAIEPSFVIDIDELQSELTYLIRATDEQILALKRLNLRPHGACQLRVNLFDRFLLFEVVGTE
ncbi:hypothetical protein [Rhizobium sp. LjRoot254]|uniref:hypothetical protein n=1 Tax=Rhizobium sp. LjRoot254 TaxID=3342297 RepID=UPI003ECEB7F3